MVDLQPWRVRWFNFRGYEKSPLIELPAMSVLIGQNNVGKTSTYAPLLLLRQTLEARNPQTALLFRGDLVDFGSYGDVVTDHDVGRQIGMYLDLGGVEQVFHRSDAPPPRSLEVTFACNPDRTADLTKSSVQGEDGKVLVSRTRQKSGRFKVVSPLLPTQEEVGRGRPYREVSQLRADLQGERPRGFLFTGTSGLRLPSVWSRDKDRWEQVRVWYEACSNMYDIYFDINSHIADSLRRISYIGPLRSFPQRSYLVSAEPPTDVGRDGEWACEVLYQSSQHPRSEVLAKANYWLLKLGYGELTFESHGEYFQVFVRKENSSVKVNLADCGVGLSQLLPLLVQGCVMDAGDTLIAQQPEIHLNPAQQDHIVDFLIDLCVDGRRVIIETHSDHVLGRLRRRIAEGETISSHQVALYFSESGGDRSNLRRIPIGEWGELRPGEWPKGFFGQQLENSLKLAMAQSRRKQRQA
jgi:hypothetical protein